MKKNIIILVLTAFTSLAHGQTGIGTSIISDGAMLQLEAPDKGVLFPRVALVSRTQTTPLSSAIPTSTMVFNTATSGVFPNIITPGLYWWSAEDQQWTNISSNLETVSLKYTNLENSTNYNTTSWQKVALFGNKIFNESGAVYKVDPFAQTVTIKSAGLYSISSLISFDRKTGDDPGRLSLTVRVFVNNNPAGTEQVVSPGYTASINGNRGLFSHSFTEYLTLNAGDVVSIEIKRTSGTYASGVGTAVVTFKQSGDASIAILRIR